MKLAGLRIAIGGAGQGVGAACARVFAAQGARLLLCSRTESDLCALADELRGINALLDGREPEVFCVAADLATDEGAALFAKTAHETLGGVDLGLLCAGASMRAELLASAEPNPAGDAARLLGQFRGNTLAPALGAIALARAWAREDARGPPEFARADHDTPGARGRTQPLDRQILVLSSLVTRLHVQEGLGPYLAAKVALEALVRTLAEELWPRIRVNALCLGPVATRLHEQAGTPPELIAQFPSPDEVTPLVLEALGLPGPLSRGLPDAHARGLSGRCLDAESLAADPSAAMWSDGRLAQVLPLQPPPSTQPDNDDLDDAPLEPEPGRAPSPRVRRALRGTASSLQKYPSDAARLARRLAELHGVDQDSIALSGGGATAILERALQAFGCPGDELLSPFPTFEVVSALASRAGLRHRPVLARQTPDGLFEPHRAADLLAAIGPRTRAVYIASPDNPTGAVLAREEEDRLRAQLGGKVALILDEAWSLEAPGDANPEREAKLAKSTNATPTDASPLLRVRSLSKLFGLAALRVGYAIATPELAALLRRLELPFPLGAPQLAAVLAALDELPRARKIANLLRRKRERLAEGIRALGLLASEGVSPLILVRDPAPDATAQPLLFALRAAKIAAQEAHWDPAALTVSVGTPAQDRRVLAALGRARGSGLHPSCRHP